MSNKSGKRARRSVALKTWIEARKRKALRDEIAKMAQDPSIQKECARISKEFNGYTMYDKEVARKQIFAFIDTAQKRAGKTSPRMIRKIIREAIQFARKAS